LREFTTLKGINNKVKILNISNMHIWPGGENKGIPSIFFAQKEFASRGYGVHFLCPLKEGETKRSLTAGINIYRFDFPFNFRKSVYFQTDNILTKLKASMLYRLNWLFFQIFSLYWGIKLAHRIKPDLIYAHTLSSVFSAYLIYRLLKAKLVVRVYGTNDLYWKWNRAWFLKRFRSYIGFKIPADYFIITNDGNYGNRVADSLGVPEGKIRYWRNGIDLDLYEQDPSAKEHICNYLKLSPSSKIIASTCRLIPIYGVNKLLCAFVDLYKTNPDAVCLIAGGGPEKKKLEGFAREAGISSRVFFLGVVDRQKVKRILYASDIFVLLARYHNCTNTMWEAMACGKCVVTTETEAIKEILTSEKDAVLVPQNRLDNTAGVLQELLNNDDLRRRLGDNARKRAKDILEPWSKRTEKEAQLLEDLIKNRRQK